MCSVEIRASSQEKNARNSFVRSCSLSLRPKCQSEVWRIRLIIANIHHNLNGKIFVRIGVIIPA